MGQRIKNERFRWHNSVWLEKVTGESLYDEEEEEEEDEEDYYLGHYLLHSATELDNPDYFYDTPDSPPAPMPMGEVEGYPLSVPLHYGMAGPIEGLSIHRTPSYDITGPYPPQSSPFSSTYQGEMRENEVGAIIGGTFGLNPRPMTRATNPLASPGMLFDRDPDPEIEPSLHSSISARQLMPGMEDPLALYSETFRTGLESDQNLETDDSVSNGHQVCGNTDYQAAGL